MSKPAGYFDDAAKLADAVEGLTVGRGVVRPIYGKKPLNCYYGEWEIIIKALRQVAACGVCCPNLDIKGAPSNLTSPAP